LALRLLTAFALLFLVFFRGMALSILR